MLKVPEGTRDLNMTLKKANYLNRVKDDGSRARDFYIRKVAKRTRKVRRAKEPERNILEDPVKDWGKTHWEKVLLGQEFDDIDELGHVNRMMIYTIVYVPPSEGYGRSYKVHYVKKGEKPKKKMKMTNGYTSNGLQKSFQRLERKIGIKRKRNILKR